MILDQNYITLKTQVIKAERRVLKELGFCVHIKHPHKIIVMYLQVLSYEKNKHLMQLSWNYMNDSLRTDVFVRYQPEVIAAACIYLTARKLKLPLPKSPAWYLVFGVSEPEIKDVCVRILRLYNRPKPNVEALEKKVDELCKKYQDAKIKARGGSENNTPSHSGSPSSPGQKMSAGAHNAWGGFISRSGSHLLPSNDKPARSKTRSPSHSPLNKHHKRSKKHVRSRTRSPNRTHKKTHKRRASYSRSRSNSPHAKQSRKSGREKRHRTRSRSHEKDRRSTSYDKDTKYDKEKNDKYVDRHERDKYDKYNNSKEEKYSEKERYLDEKYDKKDRYNEKTDKNGDKNDKYNDKYSKEDKYSREERDKERYKKTKHRDDDRNDIRDRSKDRRR